MSMVLFANCCALSSIIRTDGPEVGINEEQELIRKIINISNNTLLNDRFGL